ncbi:Agamous-like MADS-box protein AGL61 [Cardamine amara subsp. amara]|uniref:Agamous-like MADS-box protein AGL61 n=1 Tax=Cardamine amara subsp. amara TaxID=228776 RepID=A0ABD1AEB3_CARAN
MSSKKTKGKQKITIKKIEKDEDRMVTLSKRRNGIYNKICELSILCGADVGFLVYSGAGKPYTFGSPSFGAVAKRFLDGEASSSTSTMPQALVDAHKKVQIEKLCKMYNSLMEKAAVEEEKAKKMAASALPLPKGIDAWWKAEPTEVKDDEEAKKVLKTYEGLYEKLCDELSARIHGEGGAAK